MVIDVQGCEQIISELEYEKDVRNYPDSRRKGQFKSGWEDAVIRQQAYSPITLQRLTWRNLGYRTGLSFGEKSVDEINQIFELFAQHYKSVRGLDPSSWQSDLAEFRDERQRIEAEGYFNVENIEDAKKRIAASIVRRQGQSEFRRKLLTAYDGRCAISGCDAEPAIEAAHILPYQGAQTNHITNGLPLRADIHTLFDLYLLSIQPDTYEVIVASKLIETCYQEFAGQKLTLPKDTFVLPSSDALRKHYEKFLQKHSEGE